MSLTVRTGISQAFRCARNGDWDPIQIPAISRRTPGGPPEIAWLDVLLEGGLVLPSGRPSPPRRGARRQSTPDQPLPGRALTILITGPPGSGKTSLALELCRRLSRARRVSDGDPDGDPDGDTDLIELPSLYITSEASKEWVQEKAASFGWPLVRENGTPTALPGTVVLDGEDLPLSDADGIIEAVASIFDPHLNLTTIARMIREKWDDRQRGEPIDDEDPEIVVVDSLNTLKKASQGQFFDGFMKLVARGPKIILMVLDSPVVDSENEYWAYLADVVLRLDWGYEQKYMVRTFEIRKARYQAHVWGKHRLKIYAPVDPSSLSLEDKRHGHPYRKEGGIFIYPSIHYYLSLYKKTANRPLSEKPIPTSLDTLDRVLGGGLPRGRCTGLYGPRGGHKSHLAYRAMLSAIQKSGATRGLIISLRDDSVAVRETLQGILEGELGAGPKELQNLLNGGRLEILYFHPGYVTPEEFFHKLMMSLHNLQQGESDEVIALFNSLDQLSARFPLCAREQNFIPGIIEVLSGEGVTSWFVAVEEEGQPLEQYGLMSMADALLSFRRCALPREVYLGHVGDHLLLRPDKDNLDDVLRRAHETLPEHKQSVVVRVIRYAGGQPAGAGGFLELATSRPPESHLFDPGLSFVEFSHQHPEPDIALTRA